MNIKTGAIIAAIVLQFGISHLSAQGTAFTYQGRLTEGSGPANGSYDLRFTAYTSFNSPLVPVLTNANVIVTNGYFTVRLDFGAGMFPGSEFAGPSGRTLEIAVRTNGGGAFTALAPRTEITSTPYAQYASRAGTLNGSANFSAILGNAPFTVGSTGRVNNLNVDLLDGLTATNFAQLTGANVFSGPNTFNDGSGTNGQGGSIRIGANAYVAGAAAPKYVFFGDGSNVRIGEGVTDDVMDLRANKFWFRDGLVGLGTPAISNVTERLEVNGNVRATSFIGSGANLTGVNAGALNGLDSAAFVRGAGDTMSGSLSLAAPATLNFGNTSRQMLNLYNADYAIGIQGYTLYQRSSDSFAWFKGGSHHDDYLNPGPGGTRIMTLDSVAELHLGGAGVTHPGVSLQNRAYTNGYVANPGNGERWVAYVDGTRTDGTFRLWSGSDKFTVNKTGVASAPTLLGNGGGVIGTNAGFQGVGVIGYAANGNFAVGVRGQSINGGGVQGYTSGSEGWSVWGINTNGGLAGYFQGRVQVDGLATVQVLTITGGADLAEPFPLSDDSAPKGSVMTIDPANPGHLKPSAQAYDKRVAGILSGANGVNPGLTLSQQDALGGGQQVALTGRVYARVTAANGPIEPGDLLTTSDLPGLAMKVTDYSRAQGAVLGKAMSALPSGEGMVLVLVTLQ